MSKILRWTDEQLRAYQQRPAAAKPAKHRNVRVELDGQKFDSKRERDRYLELMAQAKAGLVTAPNRQVRFRLEINGEHICDYLADFVYHERDSRTGALGARVVEDVKSAHTRKLPVYRLKAKLMRACLGIEIREV